MCAHDKVRPAHLTTERTRVDKSTKNKSFSAPLSAPNSFITCETRCYGRRQIREQTNACHKCSTGIFIIV